MGEAPPALDGFLRALCAVSNGAWPEGGMSCTYRRGLPAPADLPSTSPSENRLMEVFFDVAFGNLEASTSNTRDYIVWELLRVVRESSGSELVAARVDDNLGGTSSTLSLWWRSGEELDSAHLFWSID